MGYWPRKVKVRRHNWITELGRKLVLLGVTGHHEHIVRWGDRKFDTAQKRYVLNRPGYDGELAWGAGVPHIGSTQVQGWSEDNCTVRGAKMMEII